MQGQSPVLRGQGAACALGAGPRALLRRHAGLWGVLAITITTAEEGTENKNAPKSSHHQKMPPFTREP